MKRITSSLLALLLALSMLIGMVPAAYAAQADTIESINSTETVDSPETEDVSDEAEEVAVHAAEGNVAEVGGTGYSTLEAAISAAADGATVTLLADTTVETTLTISKALTLDLNGKTLTVSTSGDGIVVENTTLTLTNSGSTGKYVFNCSASGSDGIFVSNTTEGTVTMLNINSNVEISTTSSVNSAIHAYASNGSAVVNMNDGKIAVSGNGQFSAVIADQNSTVNVNGGEFDLNVDFDSYSDSNDVVGVLAWGQNGVQKNIAVNIKGGTFKVGGNNAFAQAVQVGMKNGASENVTVNISGGNVILNPTDGGKGYVYAPYNSTYATATMTGGSVSGNVTALTITNKGEDTADLSVSDGTFTTTADAQLNVEKYVAEGSTYDSETGTVTSGSSTTAITTSEQLIAAITAANDGDTITLGEGEFSTYRNTSPNKSLTFVGSGEKTRWMIGNIPALDKEGEYNSDYSFDGCETITFKNMTMVNGAANYLGFVRIGNSNFESCTFEGRGSYWGYKTATFTKCTFNAPEGDYALWDYSTKDMTFDSCTFNISGKGVNVYVEAGNAGSATRAVTVKDCTVNSTAKDKAFLNIKNSTQAYDVTFSGTNKVTGLAANDTTNSNLFQVEKTEVTETSGKTVTVKEQAADGTENVIYEVKAPTAAAKIGDTAYETLDAAITEVKDGETITVNAGEYTLPGSQTLYTGKTFTIKAAENGVVSFDMTNAVTLGSAKVTFEKITFNYKSNENYKGLQHANTLVYNDCTINGMVFLYAENETFNRCTFNQTVAGAYNVWTYGAKNVAFNSCTFNCVGRCVLVYTEDKTAHTNLTVEDTTFKASAPAEGKAAIEIDTRLMTEGGATITVDAATKAEGFAEGSNSKNTLWNDKGNTEETNKNTTVVVNGETVFAPKASGDGTEANPYTLAQLGAMTRADYIKAQERLHGTMYVTVDDYNYDTNGVLGNGVRDDTTGQIPDHSKLNAYGENGYLDEGNDGANGKNIVFVGGNITSGVTGYKSIDDIGTSLLLAVPAYTNVTFRGTEFKNVMSFNYQLYTSPWSQLGELKFDDCTFNGIIVGAIAAQTLTFNKCTFTDYTNTVSANSSNPTWIRPAYGNWTKGDNEGQGSDFKSLTTISFTGNTVVSTRPVKFERIAQWEMDTKVTATNNNFNITAQTGDDSIKNVGLYFGANAKFDLVVEGNTKNGSTAALYTAVYSAPNGTNYAGLPAGSTVTNVAGEATELTDAQEWKKTDKLTLKTTKEVASVTNAKGTVVNFASLSDAIAAASRKETVKLLANTRENVTIDKMMTLDLNGHTLNGGTEKAKPALTITERTVTIKDSSAAQTGTIMREDTAENSGVSSHYVIDIQGNAWVMFESGNVKNNSGNTAGKGASLVRVGDDSVEKYPGLNIKGGTFTQDNFIVIKVDRGDLFLNGGTLNSANSYAIEDWHRATINGGTVNGNVSSWTYSAGSNSTLEINGGTVNGNVEAVSYDGAEGKLAKVEIKGGTVNGTLSTKRYGYSTTDPAKATIEVTAGTFSQDPSKYLVEGSTVTNNSDGTFGVEKAYLAQVGETSYYTMDEAFKAQTASGKPIVLLRDYTTGSPFNSGTIKRTVDLNGHTWTCTGTDANSAAFEINNPNVTLTVKKGKIVSSQLVGLIPSAMGGTIKYDNSDLVFEGVEMSTTATSGIETNGNNTNDSVTLKNSTLNVPNGFGIYFPSSGTLTIENSTINAKTMGVQVCAGSLSINEGSAITVSDGPVDKTENDGAIQDGAAISIVNRTGYKGLEKIEVTGGTFNAKTGNDAIKAYNWENNTKTEFNEPTKVEVSGGTFSAPVPADLCAPGYVPVENSDGTYGVKKGTYVAAIGENKYATLAEAVDAANDGDTITLLANVTENVEISKGKRVTLDLNGYTLNGGTGTAKAALTNYGTITIKDSSAAKTGTIKREDNGTVGETSYYVIRNQGTMTIESGTVINNSGYRKANSTGSMVGSSLICNGDCDEGGTLTINGGTFTQNNFIAIKNGALGVLHVTGGTITSNHSAIQNWFKADITGGEIKGQLWTDAWEKGQSVGETKIGGDAKFTGEIVMDITGNVAPTLAINGGNLDVTNWRITSAAANAGAKPAVSGGTFSSAVKEEYCAPGYVPVDNGDGTYGVKAAAYVAEYNGTKYESLQEAIDAASQKNGGQTEVTLLTDVTITETVVFAKKFDAGSVLLNLGGFTLTGNGCRAIQVNKGNLYLENGTVTSTGIIDSSSVIRIGSDEEAYSGVSAQLYMRNSAKVLAPASYGVTIFGSKTFSEKLTVAGNASIEAIGPSPAISGNGSNKYNKDKGTTVTITGNAVVSATNNYAIYHPDNGTLNIQSNATISGKGGIQMCSGTLKISGSPKIEALGKADHETGAAGPIYDTAAISAVNRNYPGGAPVVTIKDTPTITTVDGEVIHAYTWSNNAESEWAEAGNNINVSGGTYSKTFNESYLAEGCTLVPTEDNKFTVKQTPVAEYNGTQYTSLSQALLDARNSGAKATVKLIENVTVTNDLDISSAAGITLNLNKQTLTLDGAQLYTSGSATINNGTIKRTDVPTTGNAGSFAIQVMSGSSLILGAGTGSTYKVTLESTYGIYDVGGKLTVRYATINTTGWSIAVSDSASKTGEVYIGRGMGGNSKTVITSESGNVVGTMVGSKPNVTIDYGTLTSNGTDWDAGVVYWASEGILTISGGIFNASSAEGSEAAAVYQKNGTVKISGTTAKLLGNNALVVKAGEGSTGTMVTELSGGSYSTRPDDSWVVEGKEVHEKGDLYVVEGPYVVEVTLEDGTVQKFDSWSKAFYSTAAQEHNATVKLLKDIETTSTVTTWATVTIDFNGHILTVNASGVAAITALTKGTAANVTLMDSVGSGGMKTTGVYGVTVRGTGATATVESGDYNCATSVVQVENGTAYIRGGTFKTEDADKSYLLNCIDEAFKAGTAVMEVTGGTFYGFDPSANPEGEGTTYVKVGYQSRNTGNDVYVVENVSGNAYYVDTDGKYVYGNLENLLTKAETNGNPIMLLDDVVTYPTDFLYLKSDKIIDLNGKTLVLPGKLFGFGKIIDSTDGAGLLKVDDMNGSQLTPDNGYLPVKDVNAGGFRLYKYTFELFVSKSTGKSYNKVSDNGVMFAITLQFTNVEAWNKIAADDNSVKLRFIAEWGDNNVAIFRFTDDVLNRGYKDNKINFRMTINGFKTLGNVEFSMTPQLECAFFTQTLDSIIYQNTVGG